MSFSINTNVASMQAQNYLRINSDFQGKTINRVTSGLRIVQSGDDAAGLAIANSYRSDESVLTQGVRNANDGLSQLQIIDGGISNISQLLDRARTLATQSASGTFTGDRSVLSGEFSSVLSEIDRQAQSIGLDTGGTFAKNLSVFIGGGRANNGSSVISNGSVSVDMTNSTVDTKGLALKGSPAINSGTYSLDNNSNTSVANVVAANGGSGGSSIYWFQGPGFGDTNKVSITVSNAGLTDTNSLLTAINTQIAVAANQGTAAATAFKNAGITATVTTDASGNQKLGFASSNAAFQVEAGNAAANAFLGNYSSGATGAALTTSVAGTTAYNDVGATAEGAIKFEIRGAGMTSPATFSVNHVGGGSSLATEITSAITTLNGTNAAFARAGFAVGTDASSHFQITSTSGEKFTVAVAGDIKNYLGLGAAVAGTSGGNGSAAQYTSITGSSDQSAYAAGAGDIVAFNVSIAGGASAVLSTGALALNDTVSVVATNLNNAIQALGAGNAMFDAGLNATVAAGHLVLSSSNGTTFQVNVKNGTQTNALDFGFGTGTNGTASLPGLSTPTGVTVSPILDSGSVNQSAQFAFSALKYGTDMQTITVAAADSTGAMQTKSIAMDTTNGRSVDEAVHTINTALQATNNPLLMSIVAVKTTNSSGVEKIMLQSSKAPFTTTLGVGGHSNGLSMTSGTAQGVANNSVTAAGGNTLDIGTQTGAQGAVSALATAVSTLGSAQAVVGRGENQFGYAINLAQSQVTNLTTAESRIRDADLANEAANLTKAQILLQAGVAALAQANSAPQAVLSLLKG